MSEPDKIKNSVKLFIFSLIILGFTGCCSRYKKSDVSYISSENKCWSPYVQNQKTVFINIADSTFDTLTVISVDSVVENACAECYCNEERIYTKCASDNGFLFNSILFPDMLSAEISDVNHSILTAYYMLNSNPVLYKRFLVKLNSVTVNGVNYNNVLFTASDDNMYSVFISPERGIIKYKFGLKEYEIMP